MQSYNKNFYRALENLMGKIQDRLIESDCKRKVELKAKQEEERQENI